MDKHYIPKIEEFHTGFEFEFYDTRCIYPVKVGDPFENGNCMRILEDPTVESNWVNETYKSGMYSFIKEGGGIKDYLQWYIDHGGIRVKYLDKDDIEDCGWYFHADFDNGSHGGIIFHHKQKEYEKGYYTLTIWNKSERVKIEGTQGLIFDGTVKNKSRFKQIVEILNIRS